MARQTRTDVLLVSMPFAPLLQPAIGLSLLKAGLARRNVRATVVYFTLRFAKLTGVPIYNWLASGRVSTPLLVGDWIFSAALFPEHCARSDRYLPDLLLNDADETAGRSPRAVRQLRRVRRLVAPFLDTCLRSVARYRPRIVGFSSVFQQHTASLALARRIKARWPDTFIVFGGANCEGVMGAELVRQFPFVDAVVSGEGDIVFPQLVERVLAGTSFADLPGVYTRTTQALRIAQAGYPNATTVTDMDSLPYPDYDDYFRQHRAARLRTDYSPLLLFETSRGCWWGERMHCTFCGLNGATMAFRSKSATRALDEVTLLSSRYKDRTLSAVDNILDLQYFNDFVLELGRRRAGLELFYEVKANLKKDQLRLLRDAGVTMIQPGIESFSSPVLKLMKKGVSAIQNIQLLKWCRELGVTAYWNLLWGFPDEPVEEYERMARLVPLVTHLQPPTSHGRIRLDRFSPNFERSGEFGFVNVTPAPSYAFIYPFAPESLARLAYFFAFENGSSQRPFTYVAPLAKALDLWRRLHRTSELFFVDSGSELLLWDERDAGVGTLTTLAGSRRAAYLACDSALGVMQIRDRVRRSTGTGLTEAEAVAIVRGMVDERLMVEEAGVFLSLAIPVGRYRPRAAAFRHFRKQASAA